MNESLLEADDVGVVEAGHDTDFILGSLALLLGLSSEGNALADEGTSIAVILNQGDFTVVSTADFTNNSVVFHYYLNDNARDDEEICFVLR